MTDGVTEAQYYRALDACVAQYQKDNRVCIILLSSMDNDLMVEYQQYKTAKEVWDQLIFTFGGTSTTRLRSWVLSLRPIGKTQSTR